MQTLNTEHLLIYLEAPTNMNVPCFGDLQEDSVRYRQPLAWQEAKTALMGLFGDTREAYRLVQKALLKARIQRDDDHFSELVNDV